MGTAPQDEDEEAGLFPHRRAMHTKRLAGEVLECLALASEKQGCVLLPPREILRYAQDDKWGGVQDGKVWQRKVTRFGN